MANVALLLSGAIGVGAPTGLWPKILNWIEGTVVNYGWVIILFTILVKVCLMPLDFVVKFSTKKQTLMQQKLAPQIARINRKYAQDPNQAKLQTNALYKREGMNGILSCLIMIVNLAVTMTVFFTLFASLRDMSACKAINQYAQLEQAYKTAYEQNIDAVKADFINRFNEQAENGNNTLYKWVIPAEGEAGEPHLDVAHEGISYEKFASLFADGEGTNEAGEAITVNGIFSNFYGFGTSLTDAQKEFVNLYFVYDETNISNNLTVLDLLTESGKIATDPAAKAASDKWQEVKDSWLWVANIWVADNYKSPLPSYNDLASLASSSKEKPYINYVAGINKDLYNAVTSAVHNQNSRWNGYFILAILAGATSFLSQWITERMSKPKNRDVSKFVDQANPAGGTMKFMKILLPALMVIFVLSSSAAVGIYIVVSAIISILISMLTSAIVNACFKKKQAEVYEYLEKETLKNLKKNNRRG